MLILCWAKKGKIQENMISCTVLVLYTILKLIQFIRFSKTIPYKLKVNLQKNKSM